MTAEEIKERFTYKELQRFNSEIRSKYNSVKLELTTLKKNQENIITKQVEIRTKEINNKLEEKDKELIDKDKQIEALKEKIAKMQSILDNDSTNSGLPTSKTAIGKKKYIPNTREKSNKKIGGQKGHKKHKLEKFNENDATEILEITPTECNKCHSKELEVLNESIEKQELDYDVVLVKRINRFKNCKCKKCGNIFHTNIPNDLKEEIQYGKTVQSLCVCLTNEIYTPFNKTVKLVSGITNNEINLSEGYVTKLQKRASSYLESFINDLKEHIKRSEVYGWDDGVVQINGKEGILRTYCTNKVALFIGHEKKNEEGLDEDGILLGSNKDTIVMHDHILHNYNDKYSFDNVECMIHLIRRLKKMQNNTNHKWEEKLIQLLSKTNKDRNSLLKQDKDEFEKEYIERLNKEYDKIIEEAIEENKEEITTNYFKKEEEKFIKDLIKYKRNYLLWAYDFRLPSTNNNSERNIRPVKSKLKISGEFKNVEYTKYYGIIRSYIETCKKNGINIIEACILLMEGNPYTLEEILKTSEEDTNK